MTNAVIVDAIRTPVGALGGLSLRFVPTIWRLSL